MRQDPFVELGRVAENEMNNMHQHRVVDEDEDDDEDEHVYRHEEEHKQDPDDERQSNVQAPSQLILDAMRNNPQRLQDMHQQ